ncbi:MAG: hypothetical protein NTW79_00060 [Candidatus Berkelbacteria bacterium]|nr:hypothetical protein [Candidatus Berkelbacteria bacterium]
MSCCSPALAGDGRDVEQCLRRQALPETKRAANRPADAGSAVPGAVAGLQPADACHPIADGQYDAKLVVRRLVDRVLLHGKTSEKQK